MKARLLYIFILYGFLLVFYCASTVFSQTQYAKLWPKYELSVEQAQSDLNLLYEALKKIHPGLYEFISPDSFERRRNMILEKDAQSVHAYDLYVKIRKLTASIRDGHTVAFAPRPVMREIIKKGIFFPFTIKFFNQKVHIYRNLSSDTSLQAGYEILRVNEIPITDFTTALLEDIAADGYNPGFQRTAIEQYFHFYLAERLGFPDSVRVYFKNKQEQILEKTIKLETFETLKKKTKIRYPQEQKADKQPPIRLEWKYDSALACLTIDAFDWKRGIPGNFRKTLHQKFKEISLAPPKALAIDLRQNGGGQILLSARLFSYFCDSIFPLMAYTQINQKRFKVQADRNKTYTFRPFGWFNGLWIEKKEKTDLFQIRPAFTYNNPVKNYKYNGKVFVLTGPNTFSSAAFFSSLAYRYTNAVFIGQETGGGYYGTSAGTWVKLTLPHSKITVQIPTILFRLNVSGVPFGRGVPPHIDYTPTYEDTFSGKDKIWEFISQKLGKSTSIAK
jgi:C-terminal processing protease CtpA/Prc